MFTNGGELWWIIFGHELFPKKRWGETQPRNIGPGASRLFWVICSPPFGHGKVGNREMRYIMILIPSGNLT